MNLDDILWRCFQAPTPRFIQRACISVQVNTAAENCSQTVFFPFYMWNFLLRQGKPKGSESVGLLSVEETDSSVKVSLGCRGRSLKPQAHKQRQGINTNSSRIIVAAQLFISDEI